MSVWRITQGKHRLLALVTLSLLWLVQILWGNIDWVVLAALVVPAPLGVWLALSKPQLGWILAAIMLLAMPRRHAAGTVAALAAGLGISYLLGMRAPDLATMRLWNSAPWPWGMIAGIPLVIMALLKRDRDLALGASLLVSPYWQFPSFVAAWPVAVRSRLWWLLWLAAMLLQFIGQIVALLHYRS